MSTIVISLLYDLWTDESSFPNSGMFWRHLIWWKIHSVYVWNFRTFLDKFDLVSRRYWYYKKVRVPTHRTPGALFLNTVFNNCVPRSPDFTSLDFFLCVYYKKEIYKQTYDNFQALSTARRDQCYSKAVARCIFCAITVKNNSFHFDKNF